MSDLIANMTSQVKMFISGSYPDIILFILAFLLQYFMFGNPLCPWRRQSAKAKKELAAKKTSGMERDDARYPGRRGWEKQTLDAAFSQGDDRAVLRCWKALQKSQSEVPASSLARAIESMQRLRRSPEQILEEVKGFILKGCGGVISVRYMNELLRSLTRSLNADLIDGIVGAFDSSGVEADSETFEMLTQLHWASRNFEEVKKTRQRLRASGLQPTSATTIVFLKTALQESDVQEALRCMQEVRADEIPAHLTSRIVEIACRERRLDLLLPLLEEPGMPLKSEIVNLVLKESLTADDAMRSKVVDLVSSQKAEKDARTFSLLIRAVGDDTERIEHLMEEAASFNFKAGAPAIDVQIAQAVLATGEVKLATKMATMLTPGDSSQVPAVLALLRFYADAGHPQLACEAYDKLLRPKTDGAEVKRALPLDMRTKKSLLEASQACGRADIMAELGGAPNSSSRTKDSGTPPARTDLEDALAYLEEMHCSGQQASERYQDAMSILLASPDGAHRAQAFELASTMVKDQVIPSKQLVCTLLKNLKSSGSSKTDEAQTALQLADLISSQIDEGILCMMLEAGIRVGSKALVKKTLQEHLYKDDSDCRMSISRAHSFGTLIKAYGFVKDVEGCWRCWKEMAMQRVQITSITAGCMVEAVASNGDVADAHEIIHELLNDENTRPQVNSVLYGSILKAYSRSHRIDRVWAVFEEMQRYKIEPSLQIFNSIVDCCARTNEMHQVARVLSLMKSCGLKPDLITHSTMIKGCCTSGNMQTAFELFEELPKMGIEPDEVLYSIMLEGCQQAGLDQDAVSLVEKMVAKGTPPTSRILCVLVKLLGTAKKLDRAFEISQDVSAKFYNGCMNKSLFCALVQACIGCKEFERGARFYIKMNKGRSEKHVEHKTGDALLRGLLSHHKVSMAAEVLRLVLGLAHNKGKFEIGDKYEDELLIEVLKGLLESKGAAQHRAAPLLEELWALRPNLQVPASLERKVWKASSTTGRPKGAQRWGSD